MTTEDTFTQIATHLEFLGYEIGALDADGWRFARHAHRWSFSVRAFPQGISLYCAVPIPAALSRPRAACLEALNDVSEHSRVTRVALFQDDAGTFGVRIRALLSGVYNRAVFATLMDLWHHDLDLVERRFTHATESGAAERDRLAAITANATLH